VSWPPTFEVASRFKENVMENPRQTPSVGGRDPLLMALTVSSGAIDAITYLVLGKVFAAFMTGNVVFLGFRAAGAGDLNAVRIAISLAAFSAGGFLTRLLAKSLRFADGSFGRDSGAWLREMTIALGIVVIAQAGCLTVWVATGGWPSNGVADILVAIWSLAMGAQSAAVASFGIGGVYTTAATGTIIFLMDWPRLATDRRRLVGVLISLFFGAAAGGLLLKYARVYAPVLPLIGGVLALAIAAITLRKRGAVRDRG
jgi:uncharacterized membrane protein YoaK (UPF0700 family)